MSPDQNDQAPTASKKGFRIGPEERILGYGLLGVLALIGLFALFPNWQVNLQGWVDQWTDIAVGLGYFGGFASSVIGNLTLLSPFPYTVVIVILAALGFNPLWLGLLTGIGSEIGELNGYLIGRGGAKWFARQKPDAEASIRRLIAHRPKLLPWILFIFGVLPLPDDVLFIPLGMVKYPFWKLVWPNLLGKIVAGLAITYTVHFTQANIFDVFTADANWYVNMAVLAVVLLLFYGFLKIPWEKLVRKLAGPDLPPTD